MTKQVFVTKDSLASLVVCSDWSRFWPKTWVWFARWNLSGRFIFTSKKRAVQRARRKFRAALSIKSARRLSVCFSAVFLSAQCAPLQLDDSVLSFCCFFLAGGRHSVPGLGHSREVTKRVLRWRGHTFVSFLNHFAFSIRSSWRFLFF